MNGHNDTTFSKLRLWQQNVNASNVTQFGLFNDRSWAEYDVLALQEPYLDYLNNTRASRDWHVVYPSTHLTSDQISRSITFVRSNIAATCPWEQLSFPSPDVTVIQFRVPSLRPGRHGRPAFDSVTIFNIYNDGASTVTEAALREFFRLNHALLFPSPNSHIIWLGDFNRHDPAWDNPEDVRLFTPSAQEASERFMTLLSDLDLRMALPAGIPTHRHFVSKLWSRLDNVFCTPHTLDLFIHCDTKPELQGPTTDHVPIVSILDLSLAHVEQAPSPNFRLVDWAAFRANLEERLASSPLPVVSYLTSEEEFIRAVSTLTSCIQTTIASHVPLSRPSPHSKRWWTRELADLRRDMTRTARQAYKFRDLPGHVSHAVAGEAKRQYKFVLDSTKRHHWKDWLENITGPDLWTANRFISTPLGDAGKTKIPPLKVSQADGSTIVASSEAQKAEVLAKSFFPPRPAESSVPTDFIYDDPIPGTYHNFSRAQIRAQVSKLSPYKAPGPDGIPNVVLMKCIDVIIDRIFFIFRAIFTLRTYYGPWKEFLTIVLRKFGRAAYDLAKSFRPIALLCTLAKLLSALVAGQLSYLTERHQLLPATHFGGRPGHTTTDAMHYLVHHIKHSWRQDKVVSVLFLDIEGAFPNAVHDRVLHNMRKRRVPLPIVDFVGRMLANRRTRLRFDNFTSDPFVIDNGIGQGCPFSFLIYIYYNADVLDIPEGPNELASGYADDTIFIATGKTFEETHHTLASMMTRPGGGVEWSRTHNSRFEPRKLALVDFTRNKVMPHPPLVIPDLAIVPSSPSAKYLGAHFDRELRWHVQAQYAVKRGLDWTLQLRRLAKPSSGLSPGQIRRLFIAVALPKMGYALDVWCSPLIDTGGTRLSGSVGHVKAMARVQRLGALAITGGLRTSPTAVLDAHAYLLPTMHWVDKICTRAAVRIVSLPTSHPLFPIMRHCARHVSIARHREPLHDLFRLTRIVPDRIETLAPVSLRPGSSLPFTTIIADSREAAVASDATQTNVIRIYSDGSALEGKVGASAVLLRLGQAPRMLHFHLGKLSHHTVYEAELVGLVLGIHLIQTEADACVHSSINVDNQSALKSPSTAAAHSGQHLVDEFVRLAKALKRERGPLGYRLELRWVAGHEGVVGNELADGGAKSAARGLSSALADLPAILRSPLPYNCSALVQSFTSKITNSWASEWALSSRSQQFRRIGPSLPSNAFLKLVDTPSLRRAGSSILFQLRCGHVPLNHYLHRFALVNSSRCPACGAAEETVVHFLLECPKYRHERYILQRACRTRRLGLDVLLDRQASVIPLLAFVHATGRFIRREFDPG